MRHFIPVLLTSLALAQNQAGSRLICESIECSARFPIQLFEPALGSDRLFTVTGPGVLGHMHFDTGVLIGYQRQPLTIFDSAPDGLGEADVALVENQTTADITGAVGLFGRAQVGVALPVALSQSGDYYDTSTGDGASRAGLGDVRLDAKIPIMGNGHGFGLSFVPVVTAPTARLTDGDEAYLGDANATVRPRLSAGYRLAPVNVAANVGYLVREQAVFVGSSSGENIEINDQILWGAGAGVMVGSRVQFIGEFFGRNAAASPRDLTLAPTEVDLGARIEPMPHRWPGGMITLGGGTGLHKGIGAPTLRGFVAVNWTPDFADLDRDGIFDRSDQCPERAEDRDGFEDSDGCPEVDNDRDLIPDVADRCPDQPEDRDTFEDDDGCPDEDNDKDGIPDIQDECPFAPGPPEFRGCTAETFDSDNDGVKDSIDQCRDEAEDLDEFEDEDGCPDPDNDGDQIPDAFDDCPLEAEDMDGFEDDNGCPEPDNDMDGVLDADDKCPEEQEVINGVDDDDGCPDRGESKVVLTPDKIEILEKVYFKSGKATIRSGSFNLLGQVAMVIKANPQIGKIRIEGHTDSRGNRKRNIRLSQDRAEAVRDYLVKRGVPADRLEAQGFGPDRPVVSNRTSKGREENRRVEFVVTGEQGAE